MVQKFFYRLLSLAVLISMACSCSNPQEEYTNAIPADADLVASLHLQTLGQKAGISDDANKAVIERLTESMKGEVKAKTFEQLEAVLHNPEKSGIDLSNPIFLFFNARGDKGGAVAKVKNSQDLKELLQAIVEESHGNLTLKEESGYSYLLEKEVILAFTQTALLIYVNNQREADIQKEAEVLLKQKHEESMASRPLFAQLQRVGGDAGMAFSAEMISKLNGMALMPGDPKELLIGMGLSFEKGEINLNVNTYTEDETWKEFIDKQSQMSRPIENKYLKFFPQSTLGLASFGIDGEKLYASLEENGLFAMGMEENDRALIKEVCDMLKGDVTFGLTDIGMGAPSFLALTESQSPETLQKISQRLQETSDGNFRPNQTEGDNYTVRVEGMNIYYGIHNKKLYITNDPKIQKSLGESLSASAADTKYASTIKGESCAVIINGQAIMDNPLVKLVLGMQGNPAYPKLLGEVDYLRITGKNTQCAVSLQLKDKNTNALKQIVDAARELSGM